VNDRAPKLAAIWHTQIPLAAAMHIEIETLTAAEIVVRADLAANRNLHGTAFAGSLFSVAALAGWGMTWALLDARRIRGHIVLAESRIRYVRAVKEDIVCRCAVDATAAARLEILATKGKSVVPLQATIECAGQPAVRFDGDYAVRVEPSAARAGN
jgi:thioesterase domain-containing protein